MSEKKRLKRERKREKKRRECEERSRPVPRHSFGVFRIPEGYRVVGFRSIPIDSEYDGHPDRAREKYA
jgi:hypothetical protein